MRGHSFEALALLFLGLAGVYLAVHMVAWMLQMLDTVRSGIGA